MIYSFLILVIRELKAIKDLDFQEKHKVHGIKFFIDKGVGAVSAYFRWKANYNSGNRYFKWNYCQAFSYPDRHTFSL